MPKKEQRPSAEQLGQMLINIYETGYMDRAKSYKMSFIKGLVGGLGGVLGATIGIALLLWVLQLFDTLPLLGPVLENAQEAIEKRPSTR